MKIFKAIIFLSIVLCLISFFSCTKRIYNVVYPALIDGKYDTEFPYRNCSQQLKKIGETVKLINSMAYYKCFLFPNDSEIKVEDLNNGLIKKRAVEEIFYHNSTSGTATIILSDNSRISLLTCAHIVDFPDTVIKYYKEEGDKKNLFVQSVAFKERQVNYVTGLPEVGKIDILLLDQKLDIAVLGKKFTSVPEKIIPIFNYPLGNAKDLEWGSFVYLIGYPRGYKMITKGIVSNPNRDKNGAFMIDAPFNRGFSGGIVLAVKDGVPNFEIVGIAKSAAADYKYIIAPSEDFDFSEYEDRFPFNGDVYVQHLVTIQYGVTYIIPVESIKNLFKKNQKYFIRNGYYFSSFIGES